MPLAPVTLHLSEECWRFLRAPHPGASTLRSDLRALLDRPPRLRVDVPNPEPRYSVDAMRVHVWQLIDHVASVYGALLPDDPDRRMCEQCLAEIDESMRRSS